MIRAARGAVALVAVALATTSCVYDEEKQAPVSYACKTFTADQVVVESGFPADFAKLGISVTQVDERVCDARLFLLRFHLAGTRAAFDRLTGAMRIAPVPSTTGTVGGASVPQPEPGRYEDRITTKSLGSLERDLELSVPLAQLPLTDASTLHGEYVLSD